MFLSPTIGILNEPLSGRRWDSKVMRAQIDQRIVTYAALGLQPGDNVFLHNGNRLEFFADLCAIWLHGGCAVPVDSRLTGFEIDKLALAARPRLSIWGDRPDTAIADRLGAAGATLVDASDLSSRQSASARLPNAASLLLDAPALMLFTSGTTGSPKGVVHTHRTLRARWIALRQALGVTTYRRTLCLLPTHFGHGLICNALFPWLSGAELFILPPFRADIITDLGRLLDEHEITFMSSVPSFWRLALRTAKPPARKTVERVFCGSAPLSAAMWRDIQAWTGTNEVWNAYGITETGSWTAGTSIADFTPEDGLVGAPWGCIIAVLRSATTQPGPVLDDSCAPGEPGYVWINTPALMRGYYGRDDLTRSVVSNGWFMTGDIGLLDERGRLYLRGRERDEINKGGMKVFPSDVDAVIETFHAVSDVCTFGYHGDPLYGENVGVAVAMSDTSEALLRALHAHTLERLASHQMPVRWYVMDAIPRTSRGKVNREHVAELCRSLGMVDWRKVLR